MEKELTKNEKGITLVALIITIIILLILAVVSIRAIKDGGILSKTQTAKEVYLNSKQNELEILKSYESNMKSGEIKIEDVLSKAYASKNEKYMVTGAIKKNNEEYILISKWVEIDSKNTLISNNTLIENISDNFNTITVTVYDSNKQEEKIIKIDSNKFIKFTSGDSTYYVSLEYIIQDPKDGEGCDSGNGSSIYFRNSEYDQYYA